MWCITEQDMELTPARSALRIDYFLGFSVRVGLASHSESALDVVSSAKLRGKRISRPPKAISFWIASLDDVSRLVEVKGCA
jgi:hypothetical protein